MFSSLRSRDWKNQGLVFEMPLRIDVGLFAEWVNRTGWPCTSEKLVMGIQRSGLLGSTNGSAYGYADKRTNEYKFNRRQVRNIILEKLEEIKQGTPVEVVVIGKGLGGKLTVEKEEKRGRPLSYYFQEHTAQVGRCNL